MSLPNPFLLRPDHVANVPLKSVKYVSEAVTRHRDGNGGGGDVGDMVTISIRKGPQLKRRKSTMAIRELPLLTSAPSRLSMKMLGVHQPLAY